MINLEELKEKKITMNEMFIFQELLEKINIKDVSEEINFKIKAISENNYTDEENRKLRDIEKCNDKKKQLEDLKILKNQRINRIGLEVEQQVRMFILQKLFNVKKLFSDLLISFTESDEKNYDIDTMTKIFNIMWINGLYKISLLYLKGNINSKKK